MQDTLAIRYALRGVCQPSIECLRKVRRPQDAV
jgi:hypothetical protein